jgi:ABC-2 type transport system permease protein
MAAMYRIYAKEAIAYPSVIMIWFLADTLTSVLLPFVWVAAAGTSNMVAGMTRSEMVTYYLIVVVLSQFTTSHLMWDIAYDIQEGMVSSYLVRPLDYMLAKVCHNVAWRTVKFAFFLPVMLFCLVIYHTLAPLSPMYFGPEFFLAAVLGLVLSFLANFAMAMVCFWVVEGRSIMETYYLPETFLSGRVLPLSALPPWAIAGGQFLFFKYTNAFAVDICMGKTGGVEMWRGFGIQCTWIFALGCLGRFAFERGRRQYTGVGN